MLHADISLGTAFALDGTEMEVAATDCTLCIILSPSMQANRLIDSSGFIASCSNASLLFITTPHRFTNLRKSSIEEKPLKETCENRSNAAKRDLLGKV